MRASHRNSGFTLVELMIVVLIIAIISAIAIPSYNSYVMRTHRAAARSCMSEYSQFMERYYTSSMTYVGASPSMGCSTDSNLNQRYTITVTNVAARAYLINAAPIGAQATRDAKCGTLTLDQSSTRGKSGTATTVQECW